MQHELMGDTMLEVYSLPETGNRENIESKI